MATRRVNVKFLLIILACLSGAGVAVAVVSFLPILRDNPKHYVAMGDKYMHEGNYADAIHQYQRAASLHPKDEADILVKLGDAYHQGTRFDSAYLGKDRDAYGRALNIDPTNLAALQKLMAGNIEAVEFIHKEENFQALRDTAQRILEQHPKDTELLNKAKAYLHIATVAQWLRGISTSDDEVKENMTALVDLMKQDKVNPDVPYYLALAYVNLAMEKRRQGEGEEANNLFRKAVSVFEQATASQEDNPVLLLRYYQVLQDANLKTQNDVDVPPELKYVPQMQIVLDKAVDLVNKQEAKRQKALDAGKEAEDEADTAFADIYLNAADFANKEFSPPVKDKKDKDKDKDKNKDVVKTIDPVKKSDPAKAEELLRRLIEVRPHDQSARLALARLVHSDPAKRAGVIALLEQPITDPGLPGIGSYHNKATLENDTDGALIDYQIEEYRSTANADARAAILGRIQDRFQRLSDRVGISFVLLRLQGKIQLLTPGSESAVAATQILERARDLENQQIGSTARDWELAWLLAQAYSQGGQTALAQGELEKLGEGVPDFLPARLMLAKLLLAENDMAGAKAQIDFLKQKAPDSREVRELKLQYLMNVHPDDPEIKKDVEDIIGSNTAGTIPELLTQARTLRMVGDVEQAVTMLEDMRKKAPAEVGVVQLLADIYLRQGHKDKAAQVVKEALDKAPNDGSLIILKLELEGAPLDKIRDAQRAAIAQIADPFSREMSFFSFENSNGNLNAALPHLAEAEKIKPDDKNVLELRFLVELAHQPPQWEEAQATIRKLAAVNADEAHGQIYQFRFLMAQQNYEAAGAVARQLVHDLPAFATTHICLAKVFQAQGQIENAEKEYEKALEDQSQNQEALQGVIECFKQLNRPADVLRYIKAGLVGNPGSAYLQEQMIQYELNYRDPREAIPARKAQLDANKNDPVAWLNLGAVYFQVASVAMKPPTTPDKAQEAKTNIEQARQLFAEALKKWPDDPRFYAYLADLAGLANDFASGEAALKEFAAHNDTKGPWLMLSEYYQHFGKMPEAEQALITARDKSKNAPEEQMKLAALYCQMGKFDQALKTLDPASPDHRIQTQRVETMVMGKKLDDADKLLQTLVAANPNDARYLATQGFVFLAENKVTNAMACLDRCLKIDPQNQSALYYRGTIYLHLVPPDVERASRDLMAARDLNPQSVEIHMALADALSGQGDVEGALHELEKAVQLMPGVKDLRMKLIEAYSSQHPPRWLEAERSLREAEQIEGWKTDPDWRRVEADMWVVRGQYAKALDRIHEAMQLTPPNNFPLIQDYLNILQLDKQWRELEDACNKLLQAQPMADNAWWVYMDRAAARRYLDQREDSLKDYDTAMQLASQQHNSDAVAMIVQSVENTIGIDAALHAVIRRVDAGEMHWGVIAAWLFFKKQDSQSAVAMIEKVLSDSKNLTPLEFATAQQVAGTIYLAAMEYHKAWQMYDSILKNDPNDLNANNNMAELLVELIQPPDPRKAREYSEKAMSIMSAQHLTDPSVMDTHGWVLVQCGQMDDGISLLQASVFKRPMVDSYYHLGASYLMKNAPADAVKCFEKAKNMIADPKNKQVVNVALESKIDAALQQAKHMLPPDPGQNP